MEKTKRQLISQVKFFGQGVLGLQDNSELTMWVSKPESGDYFHLNTTFYGLAAKGSKALTFSSYWLWDTAISANRTHEKLGFRVGLSVS